MLLRTTILAAVLLCPAAAQTADAPTIQALLVEVRQLRVALERSALVTPKIQLTMQRLQLQDQKVTRMSTQLDTVHQEIARQTSGAQHAAQQLTAVEQQLLQEADPAHRKQLEERRTALKFAAAQVVDPQLLARESELSSALHTERALSQELSDKLASMEHLLDTPPVPPVSPAAQQR